jgi:uncharacterized protein
MHRFVSLAAISLLVFSAPVVTAEAASFDCAKASTPFEKAICGDDDLSTADERLARTYAYAIGGLSESALSTMRTGQREWLGFAQRACTRDAIPLTSGSYDDRGLRCLVDLFDSRSRVLEQSRLINSIRFYPLTFYSAVVDDYEKDNPDSSWPVGQHELAIVQIDGDQPFAAAFNELARKQGEEMSGIFAAQGGAEQIQTEGSADSSVILKVDSLPGPGRITLIANTYWYGHGAAHGNYSIDYHHFMVDEERWLEASDIFDGKGWQKALLDMVIEASREEHGDDLMLDDPTYIADSIIDPTRWHLSSAYDLIVQFQPYEIASYAYGAPTTRISWRELEKFMTDQASSIRSGY